MQQTTETRTFRGLLEDVRSGSQDAAWELVETYGPHAFHSPQFFRWQCALPLQQVGLQLSSRVNLPLQSLQPF